MEDFKCSACGEGFPEHMRYDVDGKQLCPSCAEWQTTNCGTCGERFLKVENKGDTNDSLCPKCWDQLVSGKRGK